MHILICENSIDGIFSGIYRAYASRYGHRNTRLITEDALDTYELFCEYEPVPINREHSQKVADTLTARLGTEVFQELCQAVHAYESPRQCRREPNKAEAVYKTVVLGLSSQDGTKILEYLGNPYVNRVFQLSLSTFNEAHHLLGFLRFSELENGVLFARVHPKNAVLPLLADHFTDRFPCENFIIYDEPRKLAAIHKSGAGYMLAEVPKADEAFLSRFSPNEQEFRRLWITFFKSIAIEARINPKLQKQNMPLRFWPDVVEMSTIQEQRKR